MTTLAPVFSLIEALRAYGKGEEPTPIKLPNDSKEPIFFVRHDGHWNYLQHALQIHQRFHAGEVGPWYSKHFCHILSTDEEVNELSHDKEVKRLISRFAAEHLKGHPVVMVFENSRLVKLLKDNGIQAVQTLDLPDGREDVLRLIAELSLQDATSKIPDMSPDALDGRLGEICQTRMGTFALSYAWISLITAASALMPEDAGIRTNLFATTVGQPRSGKSQAAEKAFGILGLTKPTLLLEKFGSVEGLASRIGNAGTSRLLWYPGELAHTLKKANIEGATFADVLKDLYYNTEQNLTIARQKKVEFSCQLSILGGLEEGKFGELFGAIGSGGLYDRFLFGHCPTGFEYLYRPLEGPVEECRPTSVTVDPDVWELRNEWIQTKGINPRVSEHVIRVAAICAGFDGRSVLRAKDLGPALVLAQYQERTRILLRPNEGETYEGKLAMAFLNYLERYGAPDKVGDPYKWIARRTLFQGTDAYKIGANVGDKALAGLEAAGEVEQSKLGKQESVRRLR